MHENRVGLYVMLPDLLKRSSYNFSQKCFFRHLKVLDPWVDTHEKWQNLGNLKKLASKGDDMHEKHGLYTMLPEIVMKVLIYFSL